MGATQTITGVHRQTHGLTQQHADRAAPSLAPTGRHTRGHRHGGLRGGLGSQCVGITVAAGGPLCSWSLEEAWVGQGVVGLGQDPAGGFKEGTVDSPCNGEQHLLSRRPLSIKPHFSVHKNAPPDPATPNLSRARFLGRMLLCWVPGHTECDCTHSEKGGPGGNQAWHTPRVS